MNWFLAIPTYNQHDFLFKQLIPSVFTSTVKPDSIFIWDNGNCIQEWLMKNKHVTDAYPKDVFIPIRIVQQEDNVGLSRAWNAAMVYGKEQYGSEDFVCIQSNDDVTYYPDTFELLLNAYKNNPDIGFYYPAGANAGNSFSLFLLARDLWEQVGPFDERIMRAYFEDNDYHYRMKLYHPKYTHLAGVVEAQYNHVGSATIKAEASDSTKRLIREKIFRRNQRYYVAKWGGLPNSEKYTHPFNNDPNGYQTFVSNDRDMV